MSRLTLLFFGAAKDVPEAAKMVTAGTARLELGFPEVVRDEEASARKTGVIVALAIGVGP